jgi:O-succinylbenzoic acid--CoA ligase
VSVELDARGCLVINAPRISEDPVITNDLAELVDNRHFRWLGRVDHVINRGGQKIIPEMVEKLLVPFIGQRFYLAGIPDEKFGSVPVLFIESDPWSETQLSELQSAINDLLPHISRPTRIFFKSRFEETPSGKVKRTLLE